MRLSSTTAALIVGWALPALAADLPYRSAPLIAPPPSAISWTGFHIGVNAGATFGGSSTVTTAGINFIDNNAALNAANGGGNPVFPNQGAAIASALTNIIGVGSRTGGVLGGQIGYDHQFTSNFLLGFETDIQGVVGSAQRGAFANANTIGAAFGGLAAPVPFLTNAVGAVSRRLEYFGTVRARAGYVFTPNLMAYVTGGLAYGQVRSTALSFASSPGVLGNGTFGAFNTAGGQGAYSDTRVGYTVGGGIEWMFSPSWSVKAEYLYYDLGVVNYNGGQTVVTNAAQVGFGFLPPPGIISVTQTRVRFRQDGHVARVGLNYHFNWGGPASAF